jgi:hypothetical protein
LIFTPQFFAAITLFITNSEKLLEKSRTVNLTRIVLKKEGGCGGLGGAGGIERGYHIAESTERRSTNIHDEPYRIEMMHDDS